MKHSKCPNCHHSDIEDFFTVHDAPVHSLVTLKDYDEAMGIERKDINMAFCNNCGFIFNSTFDTTLDYYTKGYEDQQGFSPPSSNSLPGSPTALLTNITFATRKLLRLAVEKEISFP